MKQVGTHRARNLRQNSTDAEKTLWEKIRNRQISGVKFRRQHPIGKYIVDFVCLESRLVVEVDGGQHVEDSERDAQRTRELNEMGFIVVRYWNHEVLTNLNGVLEDLEMKLKKTSPSPQPSPRMLSMLRMMGEGWAPRKWEGEGV